MGVLLQIHADGEDADATRAIHAGAAAVRGRFVVDRLAGRARVQCSATADAKDDDANQKLAAEVMSGSHVGLIPRDVESFHRHSKRKPTPTPSCTSHAASSALSATPG